VVFGVLGFVVMVGVGSVRGRTAGMKKQEGNANEDLLVSTFRFAIPVEAPADAEPKRPQVCETHATVMKLQNVMVVHGLLIYNNKGLEYMKIKYRLFPNCDDPIPLCATSEDWYEKYVCEQCNMARKAWRQFL
jgi:hypothetical protein